MERKVYESPILEIENFAAHQAIAACTDQIIAEYIRFTPVTAYCIIDSQEDILINQDYEELNWYMGSSCGSNSINPYSTDTSSKLFNYGGQWVFVWYNNQVHGQPDTSALSQLNSYCAAAGVPQTSPSDSHGPYQGYHAARIDDSKIEEWTDLGFSGNTGSK